jgi:hypothetical protein
VLRARPLWLGLVLLVAVVALPRCSGGDEAATSPATTTEVRGNDERSGTAAATTPVIGSEPTAEGYTERPAESGILVADPDFEEGARGWVVGAFGGAAGAIARTTDESKFGSASLAFSVATPGDVAAVVPGQSAIPGTLHELTVWVKSPPGTWNVLRVLGSSGDREVTPRVVGDGSWKRLVGSFETGPNETSVEIRIMQGGAPATSYVDGVRLDFEHGHALWSNRRLLQRIAGAQIAVNGRIVALDPATLTCGGDGRASTRGGDRLWAHFTCIQPTFPPGELVGRDALFRVHVTGPRTFAVTDTRRAR